MDRRMCLLVAVFVLGVTAPAGAAPAAGGPQPRRRPTP